MRLLRREEPGGRLQEGLRRVQEEVRDVLRQGLRQGRRELMRLIPAGAVRPRRLFVSFRYRPSL